MGLLSPSHLHCTQWCEVDGWCDGERQSRTRMRKTYGRFSMHLCPEKIRKVAEERIGKSFTQRFSETKPMQTERWQSWLTTVIFFLTFVLSYERMKLKIREGLIILSTSSSCWRLAVSGWTRLITSEDKREKTAYVRLRPQVGSTPVLGIAICTENTWQ